MKKVIAVIIFIIICITMCLIPTHRWADCKYCNNPVELGTLQADNNWSEDGQVICNDCFAAGHRR